MITFPENQTHIHQKHANQIDRIALFKSLYLQLRTRQKRAAMKMHRGQTSDRTRKKERERERESDEESEKDNSIHIIYESYALFGGADKCMKPKTVGTM